MEEKLEKFLFNLLDKKKFLEWPTTLNDLSIFLAKEIDQKFILVDREAFEKLYGLKTKCN